MATDRSTEFEQEPSKVEDGGRSTSRETPWRECLSRLRDLGLCDLCRSPPQVCSAFSSKEALCLNRLHPVDVNAKRSSANRNFADSLHASGRSPVPTPASARS
jgi:hypothetical protein